MGQEQEFVVQEDAPGAAPGISFGHIIKYWDIIQQVIAALTSPEKISFIVRALGFKKRVTIEDA